MPGNTNNSMRLCRSKKKQEKHLSTINYRQFYGDLDVKELADYLRRGGKLLHILSIENFNSVCNQLYYDPDGLVTEHTYNPPIWQLLPDPDYSKILQHQSFIETCEELESIILDLNFGDSSINQDVLFPWEKNIKYFENNFIKLQQAHQKLSDGSEKGKVTLESSTQDATEIIATASKKSSYCPPILSSLKERPPQKTTSTIPSILRWCSGEKIPEMVINLNRAIQVTQDGFKWDTLITKIISKQTKETVEHHVIRNTYVNARSRNSVRDTPGGTNNDDIEHGFEDDHNNNSIIHTSNELPHGSASSVQYVSQNVEPKVTNDIEIAQLHFHSTNIPSQLPPTFPNESTSETTNDRISFNHTVIHSKHRKSKKKRHQRVVKEKGNPLRINIRRNNNVWSSRLLLPQTNSSNHNLNVLGTRDCEPGDHVENLPSLFRNSVASSNTFDADIEELCSDLQQKLTLSSTEDWDVHSSIHISDLGQSVVEDESKAEPQRENVNPNENVTEEGNSLLLTTDSDGDLSNGDDIEQLDCCIISSTVLPQNLIEPINVSETEPVAPSLVKIPVHRNGHEASNHLIDVSNAKQYEHLNLNPCVIIHKLSVETKNSQGRLSSPPLQPVSNKKRRTVIKRRKQKGPDEKPSVLSSLETPSVSDSRIGDLIQNVVDGIAQPNVGSSADAATSAISRRILRPRKIIQPQQSKVNVIGNKFGLKRRLHHENDQDTLVQGKQAKISSKKMKLTSPDKAFKCTHCKETFTQNSNLTRHEKIHNSIRPFKCNECGLSFSRSDSLLVHQNVHGVKSFRRKCPYCKKLYTCKPSYYSHLRRVCPSDPHEP